MNSPSVIIYDGECVFCQSYVRFVRLRDAIGPVELIDARSEDPRVTHYWRDYDLNEGMLFVHGDRVYHGADAVHILAGLTSPSGAFNRLNARIFASERVASFLYPLLKLGRRVTLAVRGRRLMKQPDRGLVAARTGPRDEGSALN